jgi:beta-alanine--pyruvate transaminase
MPFTANRQFKKAPRLLARAEGMHYWTPDGRADPRRHRRPVVRATPATRPDRRGDPEAGGEMDYAPPFQMGHPLAFELAARVARAGAGRHDHVFFTNSGSEAVDTALKMALAYHRARGEASAHAADRPRARLPRRQLRRHLGRRHRRQPQDVRHAAGRRRPPAAHHDLARNAFSAASRSTARSSPTTSSAWSRCTTPRAIAAVIVEPMAGSTGVLMPPQGLPAAPARDLRQARHPADLRRGHHRLRPPRHAVRRAALRRHARHDDLAKGDHQRRVPMGAVLAKHAIHDAFMNGPEHAIEFFHGYTYSAHPLACAAGWRRSRPTPTRAVRRARARWRPTSRTRCTR